MHIRLTKLEKSSALLSTVVTKDDEVPFRVPVSLDLVDYSSVSAYTKQVSYPTASKSVRSLRTCSLTIPLSLTTEGVFFLAGVVKSILSDIYCN